MKNVVTLTSELVRIPSVNPEGDPGCAQTGEAALADSLVEMLRAMGAIVETHDVLPNRPNVVARFPSDRPGKPRILFAPHTDTVSVAGMTIDPFGGEIRDGRVWGRGSADTKGPMAAMLSALDENRSALPSLTHEIWFAGLMGEEAGLHGSIHLAAREHFDFVIAGEPTELRSVITHKGSSRWTLHARGRAAHSSMPEAGVNAIDLATEAIAWIKKRFAELAVPDPSLGMPTFSLGVIRGGSKVNVVPDSCHAEIDIRTVPGFPDQMLAEEFRAAWPDVDVEIHGAPCLATDPGHPLIHVLTALGAEPTTAPWFCDAASFAAQGTPALALGPGSIAQAHTADEWISTAELERGKDLFSAFLQKLA